MVVDVCHVPVRCAVNSDLCYEQYCVLCTIHKLNTCKVCAVLCGAVSSTLGWYIQLTGL